MQYRTEVVMDRAGNAIGGATITAFEAGTETPVTMYDIDENVIVSLETDANGMFGLSLPDGEYDIRATYGATFTTVGQYQFFDSAAFSSDNRREPTIAAMAAATGLTDGDYVRVKAGDNGEQEGFNYDAGSALAADGALVVDATGMGVGQYISTRTVYANFAEFDADVRTLAAGTKLSIPGLNGYEVVASGEDFTTTGGLKVEVKPGAGGWYSPEAFGAVADGVTDSGAEINLAFSAGAVEFSAGTYLTSVMIDNQGNTWRGPGQGQTIISPTADMDILFTNSGQSENGNGVYFNGLSKANYNLVMSGCNSALITSIRSENAKIDGVSWALTGNNNSSKITQSLIRNNGTTLSTGTVEIAGDLTTVNFTGHGIDLTTVFPDGRCWLAITGEDIREVQTVSASSVTVQPPFSGTGSGLSYEMRLGADIYIAPQGDNSEIKVENCTLQTAPVGIDDRSLYGVKGCGNVFEFVNVARAVNRMWAGGSATIGGGGK